MANKDVLLECTGLSKEFPAKGGKVYAVTDVDLTIYEGETLCLVGESGCGKSTLGRLLLRLIEPTRGKVVFDGQDITAQNTHDLRQTRRKMQFIFQDPYASLDPRMTVGKIIAEPLLAYKVGKDKAEREEMVRRLMDRVGIRPEFYFRYPHQFSGGQRQRIGIARALALSPKLVVCDEPVSALDVSIQSQVLNLLDELQDDFGLTYLFISHDLSVVHHIADRVCVMFLGRVCELGETDDIYAHPRHPYTKFLLESVPQPDPDIRKEDRSLLEGEMPSPMRPPSGCRFHTRCPYATPECSQTEPVLQDCGNGRQVACHHPLNT